MEPESYRDFSLQLGRRIQEIRKSRGLLQEDVAATLGMTRVAIGYIEQGRRNPKLVTLLDLAYLYNVDMRELFDFFDADARVPGNLLSAKDPAKAPAKPHADELAGDSR